MRAMILAAGLGTRLRPLTDSRPKALIELEGRTLLEITLTRLKSFGVTEAIINVHHFADQVVDYLAANNNFGMKIAVSREEVLLDTGGGLKKASWFFLEDPNRLDEPFVLHNVDILTNIDLKAMLKSHEEKNAVATLAVQTRESSRYFLFNDELELVGRCAGRNQPEEIVRPGSNLQRLAFCGIHILSPRVLRLLREEGIFSIVPAYVGLAAQNQKIQAFRADGYYWRDLGRATDLSQAAEDLRNNLID